MKIILMKSSAYIVCAFLMCLHGPLQQRQPLCVLWIMFTVQTAYCLKLYITVKL